MIHQEYPCHPENYQRGRTQPVSYLVFHYVGANGGARANARYFHTTPGTEASAHYFVDHGPRAEIWQSVAEEDTAWHCGAKAYRHPACRNANSIGIEMCCRQDAQGNWSIDQETYAAAARLGREIMERCQIPLEHVLRHYDVTGKLCPRPLIEEDKWRAFQARLEEEEMTYYQRLEDVPEAYRPSVKKLVEAGALQGYGDGSLRASEDLCRTVTILDRLGLLEGR